MRRRAALPVLLAAMLGTSCAATVSASSAKAPTLGPRAPCSSQPPPPSGLLSCQEAWEKGGSGPSSDIRAQLDWYNYPNGDSPPIEVWIFSRDGFETPIGSAFLPTPSPDLTPSCWFGESDLVVDAHTGENIVESFDGSTPTPCPPG
jgi:hypothetical protein